MCCVYSYLEEVGEPLEPSPGAEVAGRVSVQERQAINSINRQATCVLAGRDSSP
jgi:hypothetical protein